MARIVLAHGILGFGSVLPVQPLRYFNGIQALYKAAGHKVRCPTVSTLGSLDTRSHELYAQVLNYWPDDGEPIYFLGHSMGGLDCRRMLARHPEIARRVKRLITVATPHYGSPVANEVLRPDFFGLLTNPLQLLTGFLAHDAGALADLKVRTPSRLQDSNVAGVEYLCVGCDAGPNPQSKVFETTADIGKFGATPNDGVVGLPSSSNTNQAAGLLETWKVDHGGAVGWPSDTPAHTAMAAKSPPQDHIDRYSRLLTVLLR